MNCPHCRQPLTPAEIRSLAGSLNSSMRRSIGRKGGRPKGVVEKGPRKRKAAKVPA